MSQAKGVGYVSNPDRISSTVDVPASILILGSAAVGGFVGFAIGGGVVGAAVGALIGACIGALAAGKLTSLRVTLFGTGEVQMEFA